MTIIVHLTRLISLRSQPDPGAYSARVLEVGRILHRCRKSGGRDRAHSRYRGEQATALICVCHRDQLLTQLRHPKPDITPSLKHWQDNARQIVFTFQKRKNVALEDTAGAFGYNE